MADSFVDVTYRGLTLGKRLKLVELRPTSGYVELPQPMPVGTAIAIATDEGVAFPATVIAIREQTGGSERPPGMVVSPAFEHDDARAWWKERVTLPELTRPRPTPPPVPAGVVVVQKRVTKPGIGVPELVDDGQDTGVMDAIDPEVLAEAESKIVDDGKRTVAMDAVDLAALGLDQAATSSGSLPAQDDDDGNGNGRADSEGDNKPDGGKSRKKRKKR
ncbi:MAG TPA: hypothetical protein VMJ10_26635 [Kofleriaceae bacterium]|nr:hypothetical protein [Kofleriaceae bacterium]